MPQEAGGNIVLKYRVPLDGAASWKLEALLGGRIPEPVAFDLRFMPDGIEQTFDLGGLTGYRAAVAALSVRETLAALCLLCKEVLEHPILMDEGMELLAVDRLYWEASASRWRYLITLEQSAAWAALPEHTPEEVWSALFVAAMETAAEKSDILQSIVDELADRDFSVELLSAALLKAVSSIVESADTHMETAEEEYRPWETAAIPGDEVVLGLTGTPIAPPRMRDVAEISAVEPPVVEKPTDTEASEEIAPAELPMQPVIPGIAPPPPPPVRSAQMNQRDAEVTNVLAEDMGRPKPETVVLDAIDQPLPKTTVGKVEVKQQKIPRVVRVETGEMAYVDRPRFVIGSKPGAVDFLVSNNHVISRRHAAIVTKGQDFYLVDLGSRNGVFVEKRRISPNQETLIYVGDVFILANEKFRLQW